MNINHNLPVVIAHTFERGFVAGGSLRSNKLNIKKEDENRAYERVGREKERKRERGWPRENERKNRTSGKGNHIKRFSAMVSWLISVLIGFFGLTL